jgi:cyclase
MKKRRLIPTLLYRNGQLVQSQEFKRFRNIGNPFKAVERFSEWDADELIYLDISNNKDVAPQRVDLKTNFGGGVIDLLSEIAKFATMPITFGGGIRNLQDIADRIHNGADKVSLNSANFSNPLLVEQAVKEFGSQAIIASVDAIYSNDKVLAFNHNFDCKNVDLFEHIKFVQELGVGEILLNSINRDGMKSGYDIPLIRKVVNMVDIPVIAIGGAGNWDHLSDVLEHTNVDAVSAANIFQWQEQSVNIARSHLFEKGCNIRPPLF